MSSPLESATADWASALAVRGFLVSIVRVLSNGLQAEVSDTGRTCRVNLYHSRGRGFSVVYAGGDRGLFGDLTPHSGSGLPAGGSDEAGKGDYFGPLVVAAVSLDPDSSARLAAAGLADSKTLDDRKISSLEEAILSETSCFAVSVKQPSEYNALMESMSGGRNSLDILAGMHADAISRMLGACGATKPSVIVVDRFCAPSRIEHLLPAGFRYDFRVRGESEPAVAAASVLARASYMRSLRELAGEIGIGLKPGAGADIDRIGAAAVRKWGPGILDRTAKKHFANTGRILRSAGC